MADGFEIDRRQLLVLGASAATIALVRVTPLAATESGVEVPLSIRPLLTEALGGWDLQPGRVTLDIPPIAETGLSVPITFSAASPMTESDHVTRMMAFVPRNPEFIAADYILSPASGRAEVSSRIRLALSQTVVAAVQMSDGSRWGTSVSVVVTRGACLDDIFLPDLEAVEERERLRQLNVGN